MKTKTYSRRDSATAVLRKLGISSRDYNLFITEIGEGHERIFILDVGLAEQHLKKLKTQVSDYITTKARAANKPRKPRVAKKVTISGLARELILNGHTNVEVFNKLQIHFGEDRINEDHMHYPSWYRCELRRKGLLPKHLDFKAWEDRPVLEDDDDA